MKQLFVGLIAFLCFSVTEAQYYLLPVVKSGQNPSGLNRDLENQQGAGLTSGWMTILQGPQPSGNWSSTFVIPFPFYFNGALVRSYKASTSGIVTFNSKTSMRVDSNNIELPTSRVPDSSICVWGLRAATGDFVVIKTFGTAPRRQLWISYNSFSELNLKSGYTFLSIVLEEGTNKIFIVDQRTQCIINNIPCQDKTSLTLGIQIDSSNAIMVPGSPNYQCDNQNSAGVEDNAYYEFIPGVQADLDLASQKHLFYEYYLSREFPIPVKGIFKNIGTNNITDLQYNYSIDKGLVYVDDISALNIAPYEDVQLTHKDLWQNADISYNTHSIKSWISKINGLPVTNPVDDSLSSHIIVNDTFFKRILMHEIFTSSTSQQSRIGNDTLQNVLSKFPDCFTQLNYQMTSFQGGGDPYYTIEGGAKGRYYKLGNTLPLMFVDGSSGSNPIAYTDQNFSYSQSIPSFFIIETSGSVKAQKIDLQIKIKNEAPIIPNTRLYVAISEKTTYKNVKNNGATSFPHVMKKLLPDSNGIIISALPADSSQVFNLSWEVPGNYRLPIDGRANNIIDLTTEHSIENFSNLEVIAWLQKNDNTVLQSNSADLEFVASNNQISELTSIKMYPNPTTDYFFIDLSNFEHSDERKVLIADAQGKLLYAENTHLESLFINSTHWNPGLYHLFVFGKNKYARHKLIKTE